MTALDLEPLKTRLRFGCSLQVDEQEALVREVERLRYQVAFDALPSDDLMTHEGAGGPS